MIEQRVQQVANIDIVSEMLKPQQKIYTCEILNIIKLQGKGKFVPALNSLRTTPRRLKGGAKTAPPFLTSALDRDKWSALRTCCFTPEENGSGTHWT
jgi:hypothetical protein